MTNHIHTQIDIGAPIGTVWDVLTDLAAYREWNPFVLEASDSSRKMCSPLTSAP